MAEDEDQFVGRRALKEGLVEPEKVVECLFEQVGKTGPNYHLSALLTRKGGLRRADCARLIREYEASRPAPPTTEPEPTRNPKRFGQMVVAAGLATEEDVEECLQALGETSDVAYPPRHLGDEMVKRGYLTHSQAESIVDKQTTIRRRPSPAPEPEGPSLEPNDIDRALALYLRHKNMIRSNVLHKAEELHRKILEYGVDLRLADVLQRCQVFSWMQEQRIAKVDFEKMIGSEEWSKQAVPGYRITDKIASGGCAVVFAAEPFFGGDPIALKVMHRHLAKEETSRMRFLHEARLMMKLDHPHIVRAFEHGEYRGARYIAMELVDGLPLDESARGLKRFNPPMAIDVTRQVAEALEYMYREGYLHRDMKPDNVLIDAEGNARLCDLGFAGSIQDGAIGQAEVTLGTVGYLSPEQAAGELDLKAGSDIYSLGLTLYYMLAGKQPFVGPSSDKIMADRFGSGVAAPDFDAVKAPEPVLKVLKRMLHPIRKKRFTTYPELIGALKAVQSGS